jgi:hypothetical protein
MPGVMPTLDPPERVEAKDAQEKKFWKKLQKPIDHAGAGTLDGYQVASLPALRMME